jgi:hypothetical protein
LPPKNYPPAAPYARLTDYLRELIQEKILTRFIVKALLYPEFIRDIDTTEVKLRRRHKTVVKMYRRGTTSSEGGSSENSENSSERLERQNALDNYTTSDDDESKIYSGLQYKTGKHDSWDRTIYESFIDHGEGAGEIRYQQLHDSVNSFCFVTECDSPPEYERESFMIGSKPVRYTPLGDGRNNSIDNITHLSTARLNLLSIKQRSEQSQNSSFDNGHKLRGEKWKNMAFEDLLNIDDAIKTRYSAKPLQERHHSMPNQFVGNRFNVSSVTEIYIPSCKNYNENNAAVATPYNSYDEQDEGEEEKDEACPLHSSSEMQLREKSKSIFNNSDEVTAEILNNVKQFECDKIKKTKEEEEEEEGVDAHPISFTMLKDNETFVSRYDSKFLPPATIYSSDSDSGMAGSYTLSPSDAPFAYHRSFISHVSHPSNIVTTSSSGKYNTNSDPIGQTSMHREEYRVEKSFIHDDSTEGDNKTKLVINIDNSRDLVENEEEQSSGFNNLYFSAMYVHWWRKENLPDEMVEAIVSPSHENSKRGKGSGKIETKNA